MLTADQYTRATRAAQGLMSAGAPELLVDGKWGTFTNSVYAKLTPGLRAQVDAMLRAIGTSAPALKSFRDAERTTGTQMAMPKIATGSTWISADAMRVITQKVAAETGVDPKMLWEFLQLEAARKTEGGVTYYNAAAVNAGGYVGLFQFDRKGDAWSVASRHVKGLAPFSVGKTDAYFNTLAAAGYVKANTLTLRRLGYKGPITTNVAYLAHNQGAGGAFKIITGKGQIAGSQSKAAVKVAQAAVREARA